ncbi:MAG: hypothetical protein P8Y43_07845, partial [Sulfurovaceae bacterium]
ALFQFSFSLNTIILGSYEYSDAIEIIQYEAYCPNGYDDIIPENGIRHLVSDADYKLHKLCTYPVDSIRKMHNGVGYSVGGVLLCTRIL